MAARRRRRICSYFRRAGTTGDYSVDEPPVGCRNGRHGRRGRLRRAVRCAPPPSIAMFNMPSSEEPIAAWQFPVRPVESFTCRPNDKPASALHLRRVRGAHFQPALLRDGIHGKAASATGRIGSAGRRLRRCPARPARCAFPARARRRIPPAAAGRQFRVSDTAGGALREADGHAARCARRRATAP